MAKSTIDLQMCTKCLVEKPLDQFHRHRNFVGGHRKMCKACRSQERRGQDAKDRKAVERASLLKFMKHVRRGREIPCSARELFFLLVRHFGGLSKVAEAIAEEYHAAPRGSRTRSSVLKAMLVLEAMARQEKAAADERRADEAKKLTDEELEDAIQAALKRANQIPGVPATT